MKKNIALRLGALTIVLTLITASLVSGTFAKYVKEVTGAETVRVAKFAFNLDGGAGIFKESETDEATFDIFTMADDTGVFGNGLNTDKFIAPGTTGAFALDVENLSEVDVAVTFVFTETNDDDIPVYYTYAEGADPTQRYSDVLSGEYATDTDYKPLSDLPAAMIPAGATLEASNGTAATTASYTLNWTWAYDSAGTGQTDDDDTALGTTYNPSTVPSVKLAVATTVTQKE